MLGRNRLAMEALNGVGAKYLVLLSDGEPYHNSNESDSTESISGSRGWGDNPKNYAQNVATAIRNAGTIIYTVGYGYSDSVLENIAGSEERAFSGNDSAAISEAFANIAEATVEGMNGAGTSVNDPMGQSNTMGQYIILGDVSGLEAEGVIANGNSLIWNLDPSKVEPEQGEDGSLIYTYEITYPITLDTAARGFEEFEEDGSVKYYPTNGYTYLNVPQEGGGSKEIAFLVPGVCGEIPEYEWSVEYYLQDESSLNSGEITYSLDDSRDMGLADLYSSVYVPDYADEEYKNKYAEDDYYYVEGNPVMVIGAGENVMKLYYNIITAKVNENHFYKTDRILADGTEVPGAYPEAADKSYEYDAKINTEYSAEPELEYGNAIYELDFIDPQNNEITVYQDGENVINLYYNRLIDERATTSAIVKHIYTTYKYELNADGLYELNRLGSVEETAVDVTDLRATTMLDVSAEPLVGYENFEKKRIKDLTVIGYKKYSRVFRISFEYSLWWLKSRGYD
ncbi:MAG: hypothetical protein IKK22_05315, partial [Firmicutes bacterium]|nr:hypothetical protein [Bacillota bacterium]